MGAAAHVGVVDEVDVARLHLVLAEFLDDLLDHRGDQPDEGAGAVALGEQAAVRVGDAARVVERLVDDGLIEVRANA